MVKNQKAVPSHNYDMLIERGEAILKRNPNSSLLQGRLSKTVEDAKSAKKALQIDVKNAIDYERASTRFDKSFAKSKGR